MQNNITYICLFYNHRELNRMLLDSFAKQGVTPDNLILIDNSLGKYKSCALAYNSEIISHRDSLDDILVFIHPDMAFDNLDFEKRIIRELSDEPNQILGFAGAIGQEVRTNLRHRTTKTNIAPTLAEKMECDSIDECCFALRTDLFLKIMFDEEICDNWHLYGVDLCYQARKRFNTKSYILPEPMYHKEHENSGLTDDKHYIRAMRRLTKKYRNDFPCIYTTCYSCPTKGTWRQVHLFCSWFHNVRYSFYRKLGLKVR